MAMFNKWLAKFLKISQLTFAKYEPVKPTTT